MERIVVAGGGTGGHLFPGVALVEELRRRYPKVEVTFVGTARGIEARVLPKQGERLELLDVRPLKGQDPLGILRNAAQLPRAMAEALSLLRRHRPQVVIGLGGYAAGPMLLAAATSRVKTALLEQNAYVGLTNRLLAPLVGRAYLTYPETAATFPSSAARVLGNPVRRALVEAAQMAESDPRGVEARSRCIVVLGGSQGARALNRYVPEALAQAGVAARGIAVLHQTGAAALAEVQERYDALGVRAVVSPFIEDMARTYASASFVIARAGATTLAEICAIGRPSILVPFPHAADDHQTRNALALERAGAAMMVRESELDGQGLQAAVRRLIEQNDQRRAMASAARALGRPDAAASIVDDLLQYVGCDQQGGSTDESFAGEGRSGAGDAGGDASLRGEGVPSLMNLRRPRVRRCELRVRAVEHDLLAEREAM